MKESKVDSSDEGLHAMDVVLGERIRHLRKARGLSLQEVSERTGFSIGFVSQIERGRSSASVRVLASIADAFNVNLSSLFKEGASDEGVQPDPIVVRKTERKKLAFWRTGISKELLTPSSQDSGLDVYLVLIEPDGHTGDESYTHDGEEAGLILEGAMELMVEGQRYDLNEGDSFRFSSRRPHSFRGLSRKMTRVLWVNARPSEGGAARG